MTKKRAGAKERRRIIGEITEELPVPLGEAELLDRGAKLAKIEDDLHTLKSHEDSSKASIKSRRTDLERARASLSAAIRDRKEMRPVPVSMTADYPENTVEYKRIDTGEIVRERELTEAERQENIFDRKPVAMISESAPSEAELDDDILG